MMAYATASGGVMFIHEPEEKKAAAISYKDLTNAHPSNKIAASKNTQHHSTKPLEKAA